jgi:prolipoprotein diacylglyceryltransferase
MTGLYVSTYAPLAYLATIVVAAWILRRPVAQSMSLNDDSDTHDFVIAGMFLAIAGALWPLVLLAWLLRPRPDVL